MSETPDPANDPKVRVHKEYEDPHFHDDDEAATGDDGARRPVRPAGRRKPPLSPRHRRFHED